jgi:hypothetical protein
MSRITVIVLVAVLATPTTSLAQAVNGTPAPPKRDGEAATLDPAKLGVSLARIRRELAQAEAEEATGDGQLRLQFVVEVYGQAPKIDLLRDFPVSGPVPYGPPTHQEVLDVLTPQEFRSPMIPFSAIAAWAAHKLSEKSKKQRCEEEIEQYRRLVMAGVAVAAPRCTQ